MCPQQAYYKALFLTKIANLIRVVFSWKFPWHEDSEFKIQDSERKVWKFKIKYN